MDWRSLTGLVLGIGGILLGQLAEGGRVGSLLQPAGLLIVVAGTLGAVLLQSGPAQVWQALLLLRAGFGESLHDHAILQRKVRHWSLVMRRSGALALQPLVPVETDPFIARGLRLIVDGVPSAKLIEILSCDTERLEQQQQHSIKVWEAAGGYAPTMGILGAVLSLIQAMENLTEPARLGSGIAVAFVATLYGLGLANLFFLPIAARLKAMLTDQLAERDMLMDALAAVVAGEALHVIEERFAAANGQAALPQRAAHERLRDAERSDRATSPRAR